MLIRVTDAPLDPAEAIAAVANPAAGAIDVFLGVVRNENLGRSVDHLVYEAYPSMAEREMAAIAQEACSRFGVIDCAILHRTGRLAIGETSLVAAVSSGHRAEAFAACRWIVDELKRRVPIWKKEVWSNGEAWIEGPEALNAPAPAPPR
ncbi:MAG: molybdenum cofactor biosynthesis protein MoaE [Chloroflexota bacterium]|jgi:molybdopterin synthase catalytic subunit|nr:molybdenum cofactor biosynthesis protein MoaE [Dehalococcoidia bacterium]MDW8047402.1 molybdenum cofactor biosynthesis protein MoaE [Chloroflexota bacterium]